MATTGSAHRAVKCALNSHKAPLVARFVSVGVSCRYASDGNIDYYARPGMCIIELPPRHKYTEILPDAFHTFDLSPRVSGATRVCTRTSRDNTAVQRELSLIVILVVLKPRPCLSMTAPRANSCISINTRHRRIHRKEHRIFRTFP